MPMSRSASVLARIGLFSELLLRDWLFPVCSPEFAKQYDLHDHAWYGVPLMHSSYEPWSLWFAAADITAKEPERGIMFDNSALILQAALSERPGARPRAPLARTRRSRRRATGAAPFSAYVESPMSYYFLCRMDKQDTPPVTRFRQWIKQQVARFSDACRCDTESGQASGAGTYSANPWGV